MKYSKYIFLKAIILIMAFNFSFAQQQDFLGHQIQFTPKDRPVRSLEQKEYKSILLENYRPLIKNEEYLNEFVAQVVEYKVDYLSSNLEYERLDDMTGYLNKIANQLGLDRTLNKKIKIKVVRDPSFNAYVYEDGIIYIHIGMLASVDNEAEIAAILSHEMGHIINQHSYKRFLYEKKFLKNQGSINAHSSNFTHMIASSINRKDYSNNLIEQEEEADRAAFSQVKRSDYNYASFNSIFNKFILIEDKYKNNLDYRKSWSYLRTHPNSEKRIQSAEAFAKEVPQKNKFLVDSILFFKFKQQAVDETINLYFENLDFDNCLELAFKQHLFFPNDQFYLFYITECTRRLIASDNSYEEKLFISGIYKPDFCKDKAGLSPTTIFTSGETKAKDNRLNNSIFNKLRGPILSINDTEHKLITNRRIIQKDTVKFLTYKDAHQYFTSLNRKLNYTFNNYAENKKKGTPAELDSIAQSNPDKKNYYQYLPSLVNQYIQGNTNGGKVLWIIFNFEYFGQKVGIFSGDIATNNDESYTKLINYFDTSANLKAQFARRRELNFDEYNKITSYLYNANDKLPFFKMGKMKKRAITSYKISEVMPELYSLLYAHNYKAVIFSSVDITVKQTSVMGTTSTESTWNINNYLFDAKHNVIGCYAGNIMKGESSMNLFGLNTTESLEDLYFRSVVESLDAASK